MAHRQRAGGRPVSLEKKHVSTAGKFEVYKDKFSGYRFRLKAGNGEKNAGADVVDLTEET